jgi:alpha-1,2-mannosyltransferase
MSSNAALDIATPDGGSDFDVSRARRHLLHFFLIALVLSSALDLGVRHATLLWNLAEYPSVLHDVRTWATSWVHGLPSADSWDPMRAALEWSQQHPGGRLYEQLFFFDRIKFQYPPSSLLPLYLLSLVSSTPTNEVLNQANCWFVAANALTTGAFAFGLARRLPSYATQRWQFAIVSAVGALLFYPLLKAFQLGQVQVWINALFALSALAWLANRKQLAGVLIGLICLLKPQFAMFMIWGLLRREWRFLAGWSAILTLGLVASLAVFGVQNYLDYFSVLRALSRTGEVYLPNQSFNGLLNRLLVADDPTVWQAHGFPPFNPVVYAGTLLTSVILIGAALLLPLRRAGASRLLDFLGAALTFTIASPIAWEHHYGVLPVIYLATMFALLKADVSWRRSLGLLTLVASFLITGHWLGGSWMLLGALALLALIYWVNRSPPGAAMTESDDFERVTRPGQVAKD